MAISCDANDLAAAAKCFKCIDGDLMEVQTYLLAVLAGGSLDPNVLAAQAKCFKCLPPATLYEVKTQLLCQLAGGT